VDTDHSNGLYTLQRSYTVPTRSAARTDNRHSRHPAVAQPRLVAPKPSGLDQSRSHPKTYPPRTTTRLASGIRLGFAHTNSCGRTESKLGEMSKQLGPYGSPGQQSSLNISTRAYHHGSTHLPVYHHGSAGSSIPSCPSLIQNPSYPSLNSGYA
jgi:hypothetical protein